MSAHCCAELSPNLIWPSIGTIANLPDSWTPLESEMPPGFSGAWQSVAAYFVALALLTAPFFVVDRLVEVRPMPGLSLGAFAVVVPLASACIITAMAGGWASVKTLLASTRRPGRHKLLVTLAALMVPMIAAFVSWSVADPAARIFLDPVSLILIIPIFMLAALAEEIGWTAFATERLAPWLGPSTIGLVIGLAWTAWHIPTLIEIGRPTDWIVWWAVWTVAQRVIMVGLYLRSGTWLWGPVLFHAASNTVWQVAPDAFDPRIEALAMVSLAVALGLAWPQGAVASSAQRR